MGAKQTKPLYRILFVEDAANEAELFRSKLEKSSLRVEIDWYETAELALESVDKGPEQYDIVICDYLLPGMTGLEMFKKIRTKCLIPFVIQTGAGIESIAIKALKAGVDDYLIKDANFGYLDMVPAIIPQVINNFNAKLEHARFEKELFASEQRFKAIVNTASDAMVSVDSDEKIVMWNQAAVDIFGYSVKEAIGKKISLIVKEQFYLKGADKIKSKSKKGDTKNQRKVVLVDGWTNTKKKIPLELSWANWSTAEGTFITAIIRDISIRKAAEAECVKLMKEQIEVLDNIKTLSGLIPICSSCKKIRDDEGYYYQIEEYIVKHSDAQFSHGFCPDCADKLFPELFQDGE